MRFDVVLPLRNEAGLQRFIQEVNDPTHPNYHRFLAPDDLQAEYGPNQKDWDALVRFAEAHGFQVTGGSLGARDLHLQGTVAAINQAFNLTLRVYQHPTENRTFYAPDREPTVALPYQLLHISGLDNYSIPHPMLHQRTASDPKPLATTGSGPSASYLGSDMRAAYYGSGSLTGTGQNVALLEYYGADLADLSTYYKNVGQTELLIPTLISTDGTSTSCVSPGCDDTEQTLDMTQALGMAPGIGGLYVYVGSTDTAIISAMTTTTDAPLSKQIGCSWGWTPADPSSLNGYWQTMAAQGQNFFVASGDNSTWTKTGKSAAWPGDAAYIVSVGGTSLKTTGAGGAWSAETAWSNSGGGTSPDSIAIPSWQTSAASTCKSAGLGCSTTLRNGPDVSANADYSFYVCGNQTTCTANQYGGTSFAAPMWAGYLALANQEAAASGDTIGFLNPLLYPAAAGSSYASLFHDVTSGTSGSHHAGTGFDLVTGWGSPNGSGLINLLVGSFTLSASPSSVTIAQGGAAGTSTISVTDVGVFAGNVTLSASGLPSGVTASFGTNPTTATSVLSLTASSTAATGTANVTITGTSGSLSASTTVSLSVNLATCTSVGATPSPSSPQNAGTPVTITASSARCNSPLYQFWMLAPGASNWTLVQAYSSSTTYNWSTLGVSNGAYLFEVWSKDASSSASYDATTDTEFVIGSQSTCAGASATPSPSSPQNPGTPVTLTANSSGCSNPDYQFWMLAPGASNWVLAQAYSSSTTYSWNTTDAATGAYLFEVWARDVSSTASYDSTVDIGYTLGSQSTCSSVNASPSPASPQALGTPVAINASSTGCGSPMYEFWLLVPGASNWVLAQSYGSSATWNWTTTGAPIGTYIVEIWAKDASSTAPYDTFINVWDTLN